MKFVWSMVLLVAAMAVMNVAEGWEENPTSIGGGVIRVGGKVLCQDCTKVWNKLVMGSKPIEGCTVSVTCMDDRKRIIYYVSDKTDKAGEFEVTISKYIHGKKINPKACFTRLVSSPDPICNVPTDFGGGKTGIELGRPTIFYRDMIKHVLSPFYYTTPTCDHPNTGDNDNDNDNNDNDNDNGDDGDNDNDGDNNNNNDNDDDNDNDNNNNNKNNNYNNYNKNKNKKNNNKNENNNNNENDNNNDNDNDNDNDNNNNNNNNNYNNNNNTDNKNNKDDNSHGKGEHY